jgi:hypothetical protein
MPNILMTRPMTTRFPAAVEFLPERADDGASRCRIHHTSGEIEAWTWIHPTEARSSALIPCTATLLETQTEAGEYVLVGCEVEDDPYLRGILAESLCPLPGVVKQVALLADSIGQYPLRRLIADALLTSVAHARYWTAPASRRHHHAYVGGLARHSLEVATMVASVSGLSSRERDLGIVAALLHDYGKIWSCNESTASRAWRAHERVGLQNLAPALATLADNEPVLAAELTELLGGPRSSPSNPYGLALGRIINGFDQFSCESDRRTRVDVEDPVFF